MTDDQPDVLILRHVSSPSDRSRETFSVVRNAFGNTVDDISGSELMLMLSDILDCAPDDYVMVRIQREKE